MCLVQDHEPSPTERKVNGGHGYRKANSFRRALATMSRLVLLDSPLMLVFSVYLFLVWVHYVHDSYLVPQMELMEWTVSRQSMETTYYKRPCDKEDLTTSDAKDLFLPETATAQDAYNHQLKHGFTILPGILSDETTTSLRDFIIAKNHNLTDDEAIWLMKGKNRWSFSLGTEEPSVAKAVMEFASNERLKGAMEKILGPNPAMIEMTAITSGYGARAQGWHADSKQSGSPTQFSRAFGHAYSIFIPLQNTTKAMGATGVCPGSYKCGGKLKSVCKKHGFQPVGDDGHWRAGDALIFNMAGWHRGAAHTEEGGPDRVILILSFTSKPRPRAESRQLLLGISYSLRWDMFGFTWNDLINAETAMTQPWTTLRALGLYKDPSAEWGTDYVSGASMRIMNEGFGFRDFDLEDFVDRGGFKFLPQFLQGKVDDEQSWRVFLFDTLRRCEIFMKILSASLVGVYFLLCSTVLVEPAVSIKERADRLGKTFFRVAVIYGVVFALYKAGIHHVDGTQWASDIRHGMIYNSPFDNEVSFYEGPSTMPHRNDVLIDNRYKSRYLAMYNDLIVSHNGNRLWNELVDEKAPIFASYTGLPAVLRHAVADYIVGSVHKSAGRFLYQNPNSDWIEMTSKDAVKHTIDELVVRSDPARKKVVEELEFLISEAKHGYLRDSAMNRNDILPFLFTLKSQLIDGTYRSKEVLSNVQPTQDNQKSRRGVRKPLSKPNTMVKPIRRAIALHVGQLPGEPEDDAWLREGDIVDVDFDDEDGTAYRYKSKLVRVEASGHYNVEYLGGYDEEDDRVSSSMITRYIPPKVGEKVEVLRKGEDDEFIKGKIKQDRGDCRYHVQVGDKVRKNVSDEKIRRKVKTK